MAMGVFYGVGRCGVNNIAEYIVARYEEKPISPPKKKAKNVPPTMALLRLN